MMVSPGSSLTLLWAVCSLLLITACASRDAASPPADPDTGNARREGGMTTFSPLLDPQRGISEWQRIEAEESAFNFEDGVLEVRGDQGWLRSPRLYADFILRLQFRFTEPDSDSGIFLRVADDGPDFFRGWPGGAYQVQIRDLSVNQSDSPLPLAHVYRHRIDEGETAFQREKVFDLYSGVDEWQDMEITVVGNLLSVRLNDELVTTARDIINPTGRIGFQSEAGVVQYRHLEIHEL